MKNLYYFAIFLLASSVLFSQPTLTVKSLPVVGDKLYMTDCDTNGITTGNSGASVTWDYSKLIKLNGPDTKTKIEYVEPSSGIYHEKFPNANIAMKSEDSYVYFKFDGTNYERMGLAAEEGYEILNDLELIMKYPFTYQSNISDKFSGEFKVFNEEMEIIMKRGGTINAVADAYGTLILPNGTFENVLRVKHTQIVYDTIDVGVPGMPNITHKTETVTYSWLNDTFKSAILSISYSKFYENIMGQVSEDYYTDVTMLEFEPNNEQYLTTPEIISPENTQEVTSPFTVRWTESEIQNLVGIFADFKENITYTLQISDDPFFNDVENIKEYNAGNYTEYDVTDQFTPELLFIRVRANSAELTSEWSDNVVVQWSNEVVEKPEAPMQISPSDGSDDVDFEETIFLWNAEESLVELEVFNDEEYYRHTLDNNNTFIMDNLSPNTTYNWHIRQINEEGVYSDWSPTWSFTAKKATSVNENSISKNLEIFPNPSNGYFSINFNSVTNEKMDLIVADLLGNIIYKQVLNDIQIGENQINIDLFNLAKGVYFVKINGLNSKFIQSIVIE